MNGSRSNPAPPSAADNPARQPHDWQDVALLQQRLSDASDALTAMAGDVGMAKHVLEYDSDRRKRALAKAMKPALGRGDSAAAAESYGRASAGYETELKTLGQEHANATACVVEWECKKLEWETARSLLSMLKEQVKL